MNTPHEMLDNLPDGWAFDKSAGSPIHGYSFATNGISVLRGGKRVLVKVPPLKIEEKPQTVIHAPEKAHKKDEILCTNNAEFAKTVNDLARKKFQQKILLEIMFDMKVCEIEGWSKIEYLNEIKSLINGFKYD